MIKKRIDDVKITGSKKTNGDGSICLFFEELVFLYEMSDVDIGEEYISILWNSVSGKEKSYK